MIFLRLFHVNDEDHFFLSTAEKMFKPVMYNNKHINEPLQQLFYFYTLASTFELRNLRRKLNCRLAG